MSTEKKNVRIIADVKFYFPRLNNSQKITGGTEEGGTIWGIFFEWSLWASLGVWLPDHGTGRKSVCEARRVKYILQLWPCKLWSFLRLTSIVHYEVKQENLAFIHCESILTSAWIGNCRGGCGVGLWLRCCASVQRLAWAMLPFGPWPLICGMEQELERKIERLPCISWRPVESESSGRPFPSWRRPHPVAWSSQHLFWGQGQPPSNPYFIA